jgi:hypothetical protein
MKTKYYQIRVVNQNNVKPENNGSLIAEFLTYSEAMEYLEKNINRYPNAFISSTYHE